jgi:hypothetical protein
MSRVRAEHPNRYTLALEGELPAEALSTADRGRLVRTLWRQGWTDRQVAEHSRMTDYTAARIRVRWGLAQNVDKEAVSA